MNLLVFFNCPQEILRRGINVTRAFSEMLNPWNIMSLFFVITKTCLMMFNSYCKF